MTMYLEYHFTKVVAFKIKCRIFKLHKLIFIIQTCTYVVSFVYVTHCVGKILVS